MLKLVDFRSALPRVLRVVSAIAVTVCSLSAGDLPPAFRVLTGDGVNGSVKIGASELIWDSQPRKTRIPLTNVTEVPVTVAVTTCVVPMEENSAGGLRGLTRGFVGVIFLGASEISTDHSIESFRTLQPSEQFVLEQTFQSSIQAAEVISTVQVSHSPKSVPCSTERGSQIRQLRQTREGYYKARDEEEARWKELRGQLIASQNQCRPLSAEYKVCLGQYWEALAAHKNRVKSLEAEFSPLSKSQD
jgi:hypothetical protein